EELAAGAARSPDRDRGVAAQLGLVRLAEEGGQDVRGVQVESVVGPVKIRGHAGEKIFPLPGGVGLAELDAGNLRQGVSVIGGLEGAGEKGALRNGLGREFWIDARTAQEEKFAGAEIRRSLD